MKITSPYNTNLPFTLLVKRKTLKLTQKEVAKKLGVSVNYLSRMELGKKEPKLSLLDKWAGVLGLEVLIEVRDCKK